MLGHKLTSLFIIYTRVIRTANIFIIHGILIILSPLVVSRIIYLLWKKLKKKHPMHLNNKKLINFQIAMTFSSLICSIYYLYTGVLNIDI